VAARACAWSCGPRGEAGAKGEALARILVIDDDASLREVLAFMLREAGHEVSEAADGEDGLRRADAEAPDLVITDMRMPPPGGMEVLRHLRQPGRDAAPPVIVLTAFGDVGQAVEAMKLGAYSYLLKPFKRDELRLTVEKALLAGALEAENRNLRRLLHRHAEQPSLLYASAAMARVHEQVQRVADTDVSVLVTGESGTGKELVARALHDLSSRWDQPFVAVNCGAIPAELMESELFGHARGAFTGAVAATQGRVRAAAGGTLFLDEIGDLPLALQPKLLRVLETRRVDPVGGARPVPVDFRLVCATNRDLAADVRDGRFREDLYYRVEVVRLHLPPLRERPEDVTLLWEHFTRRHAGEQVRSTPALLARLAAQPWPGNVRQLLNLNQRLALMRRGDVLDEPDLDRALAAGGTMLAATPVAAGAPAPVDTPAPGARGVLGPLPDDGLPLADLEAELIRRVLAKFGGNKSKAAAYLDIPRHVLVYRIAKLGL